MARPSSPQRPSPLRRGTCAALAVFALGVAACGPADDGRTAAEHRTDWRSVSGVDKNEVLEGGGRRKTVITKAYPLAAWKVAFHAEPFRTKPFSHDEAVWVTRWESNTESPDGEREPDDIHCHAIWSNITVRQSDSHVFFGAYTDGFTPEFQLPEGFGLRIPPGQEMIFQPMFNNRRPDAREARMRLEVDYELESEMDSLPIELRCFTVSSNKPDIYWIPAREPGTPFYRSVKEREIVSPASGRVHAAGAHLHPYGKSVELKRTRDGKVMFTLRMAAAKHLEDQRLTTYGSQEGFYIRRDERFTVTTIYENPLDEKIDAMGGFFILYDPKGEPDA